MDFFKIWIVPPLVGAVIGYFTNWLAIKMLFRPLKPVYIGKFKLPFTPGILPSERRRLTDSVGETVSRELLTTEVFKSRLEEPSLRAKIEESIYIVIDTMLSSQASVLVKSFSGGARNSPASDRRGSLSDLGNLASLSLDAILRSPEFRQALSEAVARAAAEAGKVPVGALVSSKRLGELAGNFAESCADDMLSLSDAFIDKLAAGSGRGSAQLFSDNALSPLLDVAARSVYSSLLPVVETLLASGEVRASLETMAMDMVKRAVGRLGPLQRLIVSAANYEKTLAETMPDTISDVSEALMGLLRSPDMAQKATSSVIAYARASRVSRSDAGIVGASAEGYGWVVEPRDVREPDGLPENDGKPARNGDLIAGILPAEDLKKALRIFFSEIQGDRSGFAAGVEKRFLDIADKPIAELLPGIPELIAKSISENLGSSREEGQVSAQSGQGPAILSQALSSFLESYSARIEGRTIGEVLGWGEEEKRKIADPGARIRLGSPSKKFVGNGYSMSWKSDD